MAIGLDIEDGAGPQAEPTTEDINHSQIDDIQVVDSDTGEPVGMPDADAEPEENGPEPQQTQQQEKPVQPQPDKSAEAPDKPVIPQGFGAEFFSKENQSFEADKAFEFINKAGSYAFQPDVQAQSAVQQPNQPPQAPVQPSPNGQDDPDYPQWARELDQRHETKEKAVLGPLEDLYNTLSQSGQLTPELDSAMKAKYSAAKSELDREYKREQNKLYAKQLSEYREVQTKHIGDAELKANAEKTFLRVGQDFGGEQTLRNLIVGEVKDGKHIPGPGSEVLNWLYSVQHGSKPMEQSDMNRWYNETMAKETNVRMLGKLSTALWFMNTREQYRDSVRAAVLKERQEKEATRLKPPAAGLQPQPSRKTAANPVSEWMNE